MIDHLSQNPLQAQYDEELVKQFMTRMALTLEAIWNLKNIVAHGRGSVNILSTINCLELRVHEYLSTLDFEETQVPQGNAK